MIKTIPSAIAAFLLLTVAVLVPFKEAGSAETTEDKSAETYRLLALFGDVFDKVKEVYVEDVTDKKVIATNS